MILHLFQQNLDQIKARFLKPKSEEMVKGRKVKGARED